MLRQDQKPAESILGYQIRERIGAGGYGEVWVAEAPGGLPKAVKLVFGYHDENRAQRELKALNRIKEVRHPFLLSLERIDIVDGRLVVVTELAEKCLKDRFQECVTSGLPGIPREELLGYIGDAAEALDFISNAHSLQHLDIKPENLLLLGGHVKVADFGLVKDIHDGTQSLMAGLTPMYAPPELFDGKPSRSSDQYSLAIVFQEMLTGVRPFPGTTAAQLAAQHLHGTPQLASLPQADQSTVRRALAKSPSARFADCRSFASELKRREVKRPMRVRSPRADETDEGREKGETPDATLVPGSDEAIRAKCVEQKLSPVEFDVEESTFRPVLFLGVGETATNVLRQLKRTLQQRLGDSASLPAIRILCVDTDVASLDQATRGNDLSCLDHRETLAIPLRGARDYRGKADAHLNWLSRRWIYNVPRSGQTECLRPLGRLAFVDHHEAVFSRLLELIEVISEPQSVKATAEVVGLPRSELGPRVFIVTSISGGVGSGMVADLAYAVRTVLAEAGCKNSEVIGLLSYSTGRVGSRRGLTVANAFSCLSELHHFSQAAGFPGDPSCDLPAFAETQPFDGMYLLDLGCDPLPDEYDAAASTLAEYLYLSSATPCADYFEACRIADDPGDGKLVARTLGLFQSSFSEGDLLSLPTSIMSRQLIAQWLEELDSETVREQVRTLVGMEFEERRLDPQMLTHSFETNVREALGYEIREAVQTGIQPLVEQAEELIRQHGGQVVMQRLVDAVDQALQPRYVRNRILFGSKEQDVQAAVIQTIVEDAAQSIVEAVCDKFDRPGARLSFSECFHRLCGERLRSSREQLAATCEAVQREINRIEARIVAWERDRDAAQSGSVDPARELDDLMRQYGAARFAIWIAEAVKQILAKVEHSIDEYGTCLHDFRQSLKSVQQFYQTSIEERERRVAMQSWGPDGLIASLVYRHLTLRLPALTSRLGKLFYRDYIEPLGGLGGLLENCRNDWKHDFEQAVDRAARGVAVEVLGETDLDEMFAEAVLDDATLAEWTVQSLAAAVPHLLTTCGGNSRVAVAIPKGSGPGRLAKAFCDSVEDKPFYLPATQADVAICYEVGMISPTQVAATLIHSCPESVDLVKRIHTRIDVDWEPIINL